MTSSSLGGLRSQVATPLPVVVREKEHSSELVQSLERLNAVERVLVGLGLRLVAGTSYRSVLSSYSVLSFGSLMSLFSIGASLSMVSFGSFLAIGSVGSVLSVASVGSFLSVGCVGEFLTYCW